MFALTEKKTIWMLPANDIFFWLNSEEGTFFLNVILPLAHSNLYGESDCNEMAPLWEREQ